MPPFAVEYWVKEIERRVVVLLPGAARDALAEVLTRLLAFAGASAGRLRDALMAERERADRLRGKIDDQSHRFTEREKARIAEQDALRAANAVHVARLHHQETQLGELHGELAALRAENKGAFEVGDPVLKTSGYSFPGSYRGSVWTSKGEERVIVEHDDGWLHIFNPSQIAADTRPVVPAMTEDAPDHWMLVQPSDSAPVVEVMQADREAVREHARNKWRGEVIEFAFARHRTEAEARGRREALEEAYEALIEYCNRMNAANKEASFVDYGNILKRLMTEGK